MTNLAAPAWNLDDLATAPGHNKPQTVSELLDDAAALAEKLTDQHGTIAGGDIDAIAALMEHISTIREIAARGEYLAMLTHFADMADPDAGQAAQTASQRAADIVAATMFAELEWGQLDPETAATILADDRLAFCRHHLAKAHQGRNHQLSADDEKTFAVEQRNAIAEQVHKHRTSLNQIEVANPQDNNDTHISLGEAFALFENDNRDTRKQLAHAISAALQPGLADRAAAYNAIIALKADDDRRRSYPHWLSARNLANETSDASVQTLIDTVSDHYRLVHRWNALKKRICGYDQMYDYDRSAPLTANGDTSLSFDDGAAAVIDAYAQFSPRFADIARQAINDRWLDAQARPAKHPGAFCAVPTANCHPYISVNWRGTQIDTTFLAHEIGHAIHHELARHNGNYAHRTPLTIAETASVFGETVVTSALQQAATTPQQRLALCEHAVESAVATVFRQTSLHRFEHDCHTQHAEHGNLSIEKFGELWAAQQQELFGDDVIITDGYRDWWSYVGHLVEEPGYVYSYAYGQLLTLALYARHTAEPDTFTDDYIAMLAAGGSLPPDQIAAIAGCDLDDPSLWADGLAVIETQIDDCEQAAADAGLII